MKQLLVILAAILFFASCSQDNGVTTFYLVRHAEKVVDDNVKNENPPLTEEGLARATRLKELLKNEVVASVYSTTYQRNINTVKPLATTKNVSIDNYEWHTWQPMLDQALAQYPGQTIVICGHGDNLLPMIDYLGGAKPQESLGAHEYDKIFKVKVSSDTTRVEVMTY